MMVCSSESRSKANGTKARNTRGGMKCEHLVNVCICTSILPVCVLLIFTQLCTAHNMSRRNVQPTIIEMAIMIMK